MYTMCCNVVLYAEDQFSGPSRCTKLGCLTFRRSGSRLIDSWFVPGYFHSVVEGQPRVRSITTDGISNTFLKNFITRCTTTVMSGTSRVIVVKIFIARGGRFITSGYWISMTSHYSYHS